MKISVFGAAAAALLSVSEAASNITHGRGSPGCGKKVKGVGGDVYEPRWNVSGVWRQYRTHTPIHYDKDKPAPLILAFHASHTWWANLARKSRFSSPSINPDMMVQYMIGYKRQWTGPSDAPGTEANDIEYVEKSLERLMNNYCIDVDRVYLVGHAGGGGFANLLACHPRLSRHFAAVALMAPTLWRDLDDAFCKNSRLPMPVLEAHGMKDELTPYWGDPARSVGALPAISDWLRRWVRRNGCDPVPRRSLLRNKHVMSEKYTCHGHVGFVEHITAARQRFNWMTAISDYDISPAMINFFGRFVRPGNLTIPLDASGKFVASGGHAGKGNSTASGNLTSLRRP